MIDFDEKIQLVTQICGDTIRTILGRKTNFIVIPIIDNGDSDKVAVSSNLSPKELCVHLAAAARATIEELEPEIDKKICETLENKESNKDLH